MAEEITGREIVSFITGGEKKYAYVTKIDKEEMSTLCKVKGVTLNYKNVINNLDNIKISL